MATVERKCNISNSFRVLARRRNKKNSLQGLKGSTLNVNPTDRSGLLGSGELCAGQQKRALIFSILDLVLEESPDTLAVLNGYEKPRAPTDPREANDG